jgi:hypothetical protein
MSEIKEMVHPPTTDGRLIVPSKILVHEKDEEGQTTVKEKEESD